jgi:hypothetical protein
MSPIVKVCSFRGSMRIVHPPYKRGEGPRCPEHTNPAGRTSSTYAWRKLRRVVMARDGLRCLQCGSSEISPFISIQGSEAVMTLPGRFFRERSASSCRSDRGR